MVNSKECFKLYSFNMKNNIHDKRMGIISKLSKNNQPKFFNYSSFPNKQKVIIDHQSMNKFKRSK